MNLPTGRYLILLTQMSNLILPTLFTLPNRNFFETAVNCKLADDEMLLIKNHDLVAFSGLLTPPSGDDLRNVFIDGWSGVV